jgi:hypothetical protein
MAPNLEHTIRAMPGYSAGLAHGTDIGLRIGLDAITAERTHLETGDDTACRHFADGRLANVHRSIAAMFRQEVTS